MCLEGQKVLQIYNYIAGWCHISPYFLFYEEIPVPSIADDMTYIHHQETSKKKIRVYKEMDYRLGLEDFFLKLQVNFPEKDS